VKQCETCTAYEDAPLGRCGPLAVGEEPQERHYCLLYPDGIPAEYWTDKEPCLARLEKQ
jgi:hypothetical protein